MKATVSPASTDKEVVLSGDFSWENFFLFLEVIFNVFFFIVDFFFFFCFFLIKTKA